MADPIGIISTIISVIGYIRTAADKVEQNRDECIRLGDHAEDVLRLIKEEIKNGASIDVERRLLKLKRLVLQLRQHTVNFVHYW
jgi:hypothetical protein